MEPSVISEEQDESEEPSDIAHRLKVANFLKDLDNQSDTQKGPSDTQHSKEAHEIDFKGKTLTEYAFPQIQRLSIPNARNIDARLSTAGFGTRPSGRAIEMALIEDKRATPELRKNLNTAGVGSVKKRNKLKSKIFAGEPMESEHSPSIGIFEDVSRVNQELGLENFIQPVGEMKIQDLTEEQLTNRLDNSEHFQFHPQDMYIREGMDQEMQFISDGGAGIRSILDSAEKSSVINSDILSSDA